MLFIATPTLGQARTEWGIRLSGHTWPVGMNRSHFAILGMVTCAARNFAVYLARKDKAQYLLFWDDDVLPRSVQATNDLVNAMAHNPEIDILGAVYPKRGMTADPIVVKEEGCGIWWGWQDGQIHQVHMSGTGFLLMRMSSLEKLVVPTEPQVNGEEIGVYFDTPEGYSDDFWFARLCAEQGLKWFVHGGVLCDQADLDGRLWKFEEALPEAQIVPADQETPGMPVTIASQDTNTGPALIEALPLSEKKRLIKNLKGSR